MLDDYDKKRQDLLAAVYNLTQGDCGKTAKMSDLGAALGLDRNETESLALDMVGDELLEIKSLSGALALTPAGLEQAGGASLSASEAIGPDELIARLERGLSAWALRSDDKKNLEIDLATLKLQQQRSRAVPGLQKAVFSEIAGVLEKLDGVGDILDLLSSLAEGVDA